ncbi:uncharacterized protein LOC131209121 isoform X2 [Anopheles bellator]|uniref:uncharacterized protein LOC131209121 isoform X2 n=1 Tax=Anopheles bellator TaxID=139047 RepID=UPI002648E6E6|nr:uncharacterized protein LOC131209121 isoform X2 [Anopheles bellator]
MSRNMTIPSRPAPPPPQQRNTTSTASRYTPTTDWDFCTFGSSPASSPGDGGHHQQQQQQQKNVVKAKKPPPPRPPPPKLHPPNPSSAIPALKKPAQPQSINILSSLFGQKRSSNGSGIAKPVQSSVQKSSSSSCVPIKLLPPPSALPSGSSRAGFNVASYGGTLSTAAPQNGGGCAEMQLITFDSPPSSPTFTQKSCSDCISVDSFSSDSNYSSPNGGNMSQAESGFEDDFVASGGRVGSGVPWGDAASSPRCGDPFESSHAGGGPLIYAPLPLTTAQMRAPLFNSKLQQSDFVDPLCNGRSATSKVPTVSMPTIIKPPSAATATGSQKSTPVHSRSGDSGNTFLQPAKGAATFVDHFAPEVDAFDSLPSLPMPTIPPPPPPQSVAITQTPAAVVHGVQEEPYGIALYDFEGETVEDLSLKVNEKIYLLRRLNAEWFMGRDRRGLEGMFPVSYVDVKVPLSDVPAPDPASNAAVPRTARQSDKVRALYHFAAETAEDLTLVEDDLVTVLYQITPEWLYGAVDGRKGQFPANFIEYVPPNLPPLPAAGV